MEYPKFTGRLPVCFGGMDHHKALKWKSQH
jgi:hypothetical protein